MTGAPKLKKAPKPKKAPKHTDWTAHARLADIRKQNVERHVGYEAKQTLRRNILRFQTNHTHQMEHDRLKAATVRGNLHPAAEARLEHLKNILIS